MVAATNGGVVACSLLLLIWLLSACFQSSSECDQLYCHRLRLSIGSAAMAQHLRPLFLQSGMALRLTLAPLVLRFSTAMVVDDLRYSKSHEWAKLEGDTVVVGITHHAQEALGDVVFVDLPEIGKTISQGDAFGSVESVKAVSDVYAPVSGEIVEVNSELTESPGLVNKGPFDEGWMMKLKVKDPSEMQLLLNAASYKQFIEDEAH